MTYTQTTWGELKSRLLSRLGEEGFYPSGIREQALNEAMQVWQGLVGEWMTGAQTLSTTNGVGVLSSTNIFPIRLKHGTEELTESSLSEMDVSIGVSWVNGTTGTPLVYAPCGVSFIVFNTTPTGNSYTFYGVADPPQFALDATVLQLQESEVDAIIEYAAHVAMFSEGGDEFTASSSALQKMLQLALTRNSRLSGLAPYRKYMGTDRELRERTREIPTQIGGR